MTVPRGRGLTRIAAVLAIAIIAAAAGSTLAYYAELPAQTGNTSSTSYAVTSSLPSATQQVVTPSSAGSLTTNASANNSPTGEHVPAVTVTSITVRVSVKIAILGTGVYETLDEQVGGFSVAPGSVENYSYTVKNAQNIIGSVQITSATAVTPNFTIISVSPPIPFKVTLTPGFQMTVTLGIKVPPTSYKGPLEVDVDATYG